MLCTRGQSLLPPTLQMVIPFLSPVTVHLKVKVSPGQVGGAAVNCPVTSPAWEHRRFGLYKINQSLQARRQGGGSRGFERTPLLTSKSTSKVHILSILPFESGPLVSLLLRITAVQTSLHGCSYSTGVCEFVHGRPARNARITCLRRCDERTRVILNMRKYIASSRARELSF